MRSFCIFLAAIGTRPSQNLPWRPKSDHVTEGGGGLVGVRGLVTFGDKGGGSKMVQNFVT